MTYYILPQIEYNIRDSNIKLVIDEKGKTKQKQHSLQ